MCGIAGIWRFSGPLTAEDEEDLRAMTAALAHRGPNGEGYWLSEKVGFGHRRLAILDPSPRAGQPMQTSREFGTLIYNGEVYNHLQLRRELECEGVSFSTRSDTETVLHALEKWGPLDAVPRFNGMFAFAYFDRRSQTLWLARDRLGIKPISIRKEGTRILFASEDKGILAASNVTAELDKFAYTLRLMNIADGNRYSLLRGIDRVEPGTVIEVSDDRMTCHRYWDPVDNLDVERLCNASSTDRQLINNASLLLENSVKAHLAADTPLAAFLSGGVDSGTIVSIAHSALGRLDAYVADPDTGANEKKAASRTATRTGAIMKPVQISREDYLRAWPAAINALETDGYLNSAAAMLIMAQQARSDGYPVMLTGEGADELFGGYSWYRKSARLWKCLDPPYSWFRARKAQHALVERFKSAPFSVPAGIIGSGHMRGLLDVVAHENTGRLRQLMRKLDNLPRFRDRAIIGAANHDLFGHLQELLLGHDRIGMTSSVEVRVPFIENAIIDFAMHLPANCRYRGRTLKWLLKKVAERRIPRENVYSKKLGFPITGSYTQHAQYILKDGLILDVLKWTRKKTDAEIEIMKHDQHRRQRLVSAELFMRLFLDGQSSELLGEILLRTCLKGKDETVG